MGDVCFRVPSLLLLLLAIIARYCYYGFLRLVYDNVYFQFMNDDDIPVSG